jgi:acetyltransferase
MDKPRVLEHIFNPKAVAVVGATDNPTKQGHWCVQSLLEMDYPGKIFPINPNRKDILGMKAHASVKEIPGEIDLAVVVVPAPVVSSVLAEWWSVRDSGKSWSPAVLVWKMRSRKSLERKKFE